MLIFFFLAGIFRILLPDNIKAFYKEESGKLWQFISSYIAMPNFQNKILRFSKHTVI